ncbi:hypothetical protein PQX77_021688 [Marasmius sp. AFHP31]|nr:hypothetical protein PQX77_021688 [Marasmius sp. AFHP31]
MNTLKGKAAPRKAYLGSVAQNYHNGIGQNLNHGRDQNVHTGAGDLEVINVGRDFVNNFTSAASNPHKSLWDAVAGVGATHTSEQQFARGECLEGTREKALRVIDDWIVSDKRSVPMLLLSGTAGVGKSAIAMTVAKSCEETALVASFFFFRAEPKRNNPSALMLTVAHGLVTKIPSLRTFIHQRIAEDPMVLEAKLEDQFRELILKPVVGRKWRRYLRKCLAKISLAQKDPNLVIIDGLDECGGEETQLRILSTIRSSYRQSPRSPLRFLICSRPEAWIQEAFNARDLGRITQRVVLDETFQPDRDIERYLLHEFQIIRESPKYARLPFPSSWPSKGELDRMVRKASGQFVYVAIIVKFTKLPYSNPIAQLRIILDYIPENQTSESPFSQLDLLYHIILSVNPNREKLVSILAAIFVLRPYGIACPAFIESLLGWSPGEGDLMLRAMHSVLNIGGGWDNISVFHTSFTDYLFDSTRSGPFYIDRPFQHHVLARRWLQAISSVQLRQYSLSQLHRSQATLVTQWIPFCADLTEPGEDLLYDLQDLDLGALYLCQLLSKSSDSFVYTGAKRCSSWEEVFNGIASWLRSVTTPVDPYIIERFTKLPKCFHLEYPGETPMAASDDALHWVILSSTECRSSCSFTRRVDEALAFDHSSLSVTLADCDCFSVSDEAIASTSYPFPSWSGCRRTEYQTACLQTVEALVSDFVSAVQSGAPRSTVIEVNSIFENLVDSSLLEHCGFGEELFHLTQTFFIAAQGCELLRSARALSQKRCKKLVDWLETCSDEYASLANVCKMGVQSLFAL